MRTIQRVLAGIAGLKNGGSNGGDMAPQPLIALPQKACPCSSLHFSTEPRHSAGLAKFFEPPPCSDDTESLTRQRQHEQLLNLGHLQWLPNVLRVPFGRMASLWTLLLWRPPSQTANPDRPSRNGQRRVLLPTPCSLRTNSACMWVSFKVHATAPYESQVRRHR